MSRKCAKCKTHIEQRYCLREDKHYCWVCCNNIRVDHKCPKECGYKSTDPKKLNQVQIKTDTISELNDFMEKYIQAFLTKPSELFDDQIPIQIKDTPQGKELLIKKLSSLKFNKTMASIYEKHLRINLNSKNMPYKKNCEDVGREFFLTIGEQDWLSVKKYFTPNAEITINKFITRLQKSKDLINLEHFLFVQTGISKDGKSAFSTAEINFSDHISLFFSNIDDDWLIYNIIFGEVNLLYSEVDTIKHIAEALSKAEYDKSLQLLTQAEKIYYLSSDIQYYWGLYHSLTGDADMALQAFKDAGDLGTDFAAAFYNQAFIHHAKNDLEQAKFLYKKTLEIDNKNLNALNNLGTICLYEKNLDEAKEYFQKCLAIDPNYNYAKENLDKLGI